MMNHESHMNSTSDQDGFDQFLRTQLQQTQPYLMDEKFSAQVMQQLPAPKKLSLLQERLIIFVPVILISLIILSQFSVIDIGIKMWTWLVTLNITSLLEIGVALIGVSTIGAFYWIAKESRLL